MNAVQTRPQLILTAHQLGTLLKAARKARRLTQAELSTRIGVGQSRVSSLELDPAHMNVAQLLAWCSALGLELTLGARSASAPGDGSTQSW